MRTTDEVKPQVSAIRERVKELSGFYLGEGAAMTYVLEGVLGKRETSPAGELGRAGGECEKIAADLTKAVEKALENKPGDPTRTNAPGKSAKAKRNSQK